MSACTRVHTSDATTVSVTDWLQRQMTARGLSLGDLAEMASLPLRLLRSLFEPEGNHSADLTIRQAFTLADALDTDPVDLIKELGMLSERGLAYLPYCDISSEAPLGELWEKAKELTELDRTILLECILCRRRRRWEVST